jgi:S1-C subfamily serine protease
MRRSFHRPRSSRKSVRRLADLTQELERVGVGKKVPLTVQRDGRETSVEVDVMDIGRRG